jgi:oligopeptide/dipeptide ABC transporter ATP-binding protein
LASPPSHALAGRILFEGVDLLALKPEAMRALRGDRIGMVFQEPMTSLNPVLSIGYQIEEVLRLHRKLGRAEARRQALDMLRLVGIGAPERRLAQYPHQLSGGLRQRVMIAIALVCRPQLLIADEPTTALDVTIQAQILDLLRRLKREMGMALLLITHDLGVVAEMSDEVVVMYAGVVMEHASRRTLFYRHHHPYTEGLLASLPARTKPGERLTPIAGVPPSLIRLPQGCPFAPRCRYAFDKCLTQTPPLATVYEDAGHQSACWLSADESVRETQRTDSYAEEASA